MVRVDANLHQSRTAPARGVTGVHEDGASGSKDSRQALVEGDIAKVRGHGLCDGGIASDADPTLTRDEVQDDREWRSINSDRQRAARGLDHVALLCPNDSIGVIEGAGVRRGDVEQHACDHGTEPASFHQTDREPFIVLLLETGDTANRKRWRGIKRANLETRGTTWRDWRGAHPIETRHTSIVWMTPPGKRRISQRSQTRAACDTPTVPPESISGTQRIEGS